MHKKTALWLIAAGVAAAALLIFLLGRKGAETAPAEPIADLAGEYAVEAIVYQAGVYSFSYTVDTAPHLRISKDALLESRGDRLSSGADGDWAPCGELTALTLSEENFDVYMPPEFDFMPNEIGDPAAFRFENTRAWSADVPYSENRVFHYLLEQADGSLYLTYGYRGSEGSTGHFRWVFKLAAE